METKAIFRALLWAFVAFFTWQIIANMIWPPPPPPQATPTTERGSPEDGQPAEVGGASPTGPSEPSPSPGPAVRLTAKGTDSPQSFTLGGVEGWRDSPYRMEIEVTGRGAALGRATLSDFAQEVEEEPRYCLLEEVETADGRTLASMVLEKLTVDGQEIDLRDLAWAGRKERRQGAEAVTFTAEVVDHDKQPVLGLTVEYELPEQPAEAQRYDLQYTLSVANRDDQPHRVVATLRGPVGTQRADPRADQRALTVAGWVSDEVRQQSKGFSEVAKSGVLPFAQAGSKEPLAWVAAANKFFACLIAPVTIDGQEGAPYLNRVEAANLDDRPESGDAVTLRLITAEQTIAPGGAVTYPFECYLGPQDRNAFTNPDNADYVRRNYYLLVARHYSWCTFGWLTEFMMWLLDVLVHVPPWNYGVAIIILVLIVRVLLHPITKKGQVNMMKMQKQMGKLAPKLEEIKKQYANDKARLNAEMQKLYQSEGINPAGQVLTCLPMMLQMPIWVALFTGLNNNIAMRHEPFCLWINDLTAPDRLIEFGASFNVPLLGAMTGPISSLNILPILWAVSMYLQQKMMPKPKPPEGVKSPQTDQAAQMQKMMPFMSILFALLFYNAPSGLTLYIMASTLFGTVEQLRIRQHIKEMEERGGLEAAAGGKRQGPRGPLWWQRLKEQAAARVQGIQKQADEAQKVHRKP